MVLIDVCYPFGYVTTHVIYAKRTASVRIATHLLRIGGTGCRKCRVKVVSPGPNIVVRTAGGKLPLGFCREPFAHQATIGVRLIPGHLDHGKILVGGFIPI